MNTIEFGKEYDQWQQYGLLQHDIFFNGKKTEYRTVERNNQIVTIGTNRYSLFPNEEALKIANKACSNIGLEPFYGYNSGNQQFEHTSNQLHSVLTGGTRLNAFYTKCMEEIQGEKIYVGINIFNSIDRSTAFGAGAFTFRVKCHNQVLATLRRLSTTLPSEQTLAYVYQRHSGTQFEEKYFKTIEAKLENVAEKALNFIYTYKQMAVTNANLELINKISASNLPKKIKPDYIPEKPTEQLTVTPITQWELYNDITKNIWHNESTDLSTKQTHFNKLHTLMPILTTGI